MKVGYRDRDLRMAHQSLAVQTQLLDRVIDERDALLAEVRALREERDRLLRQLQMDGRPACHEWDNTSLKQR
jgi:uncharacterized coiled-coil DUF342 family protein